MGRKKGQRENERWVFRNANSGSMSGVDGISVQRRLSRSDAWSIPGCNIEGKKRVPWCPSQGPPIRTPLAATRLIHLLDRQHHITPSILTISSIPIPKFRLLFCNALHYHLLRKLGNHTDHLKAVRSSYWDLKRRMGQFCFARRTYFAWPIKFRFRVYVLGFGSISQCSHF